MVGVIAFGPTIPFSKDCGRQAVPTPVTTGHAHQGQNAREVMSQRNQSRSETVLGTENLTETDRMVCQRMGLDPLSLANQKRQDVKAASGAAADGLNLTAEERTVCRKMGVDPQKFAAAKAARPNDTKYDYRV